MIRELLPYVFRLHEKPELSRDLELPTGHCERPSGLFRCPPAHRNSFRYTGSNKPFGPENPAGFTQNTSLYIIAF